MKFNVASALESTLRGLPTSDPTRMAAVEELRTNGIRPLVEILASKVVNEQLILKAIAILLAIMNGTFTNSTHRQLVSQLILPPSGTTPRRSVRSDPTDRRAWTNTKPRDLGQCGSQ